MQAEATRIVHGGALLAAQDADIALDVQGFLRVVREGRLEHDAWPGR